MGATAESLLMALSSTKYFNISRLIRYDLSVAVIFLAIAPPVWSPASWEDDGDSLDHFRRVSKVNK
jgi:hypothetical protein